MGQVVVWIINLYFYFYKQKSYFGVITIQQINKQTKQNVGVATTQRINRQNPNSIKPPKDIDALP